jgi:hypothetical protein
MHYFVKRLVTSALDHNNREREMASVLLSSLYGNVSTEGRRPGTYRGRSLLASLFHVCPM